MVTKRKQTSSSDLTSRAMLVKLKISCWGMKKTDDDVAQEVAEKHNSDANLGKFQKILLKSDARDKFKKISRECRRTHRRLTLPWDEGVGLLPAKTYFKYTEAISEKRDEAQQHIDQFVAEYKEQWDAGLKKYRRSLGSLFDANDYPSPDLVERKFGIEVRTFPIQDPNDFRVSMSEDVTAEIKAQMERAFQQDLTEAMRQPFMRLHQAVSKVKDKLDDEDGIFRDSLIENVKELLEVLPDLNVLNDPSLARLIGETDKTIGAVSDIKALRQDKKYRKEVAKSADAILKKMGGYVS